ncbi:hypothetical protein K7X08_006915 [Anisodus acutangulus]|uniref:Uncharacterized protein n=1 Tax=Anisodus acutangulus TaxID=402998 RepID=A0A9Q1LC70_9SOLA|nr:hypothetical protein K7X08_006915 [Anisodus acutangulus]
MSRSDGTRATASTPDLGLKFCTQLHALVAYTICITLEVAIENTAFLAKKLGGNYGKLIQATATRVSPPQA